MSLSPAFLDKLRARTLLSTLIGRGLKLQRAGREWKACCPFHNEKSPSFYVNDDKGFYHCFGCSAHGDAIRWLTEAKGLPFMEAVKELAAAAGMDVPAADPRATERAEVANSLYDVMTAAQAWFVDQLAGIEGAEARAYLVQRGISPETATTFGIGFAPDSRGKLKAALASFGNEKLVEAGLLISVEDKEPYDRFRGRLMIPIRDPRGRVIAFGGRILGAGEPKYLNSPDTPLFDKGRTLYNLDRAGSAARKADRVIVVEGYMDVIALAQAGIEEVVAPLGTALTEFQLERLWRLVDVPMLCFDGDSAGQKAAMRAALKALPFLTPGKSLQFVPLPAGKDPDDVIRRNGISSFLDFVNASEQLVRRVFRGELENGRHDTPEARAKIRANLDLHAASMSDRTVAAEYKSTFRDMFYEVFGFGKRKAEQLAAAMMAAQRASRPKLDDVFIRAVLLGLMRYSEVLISETEAVQELVISDKDQSEWRDLLIDAVYANPSLDEDVLDTILERELLTPPVRRSYTKDLGFSFYHPNHERGPGELRQALHFMVDEHKTREALARAQARLTGIFTEADWQRAQLLREEMEEFERQRNAWTERLQDAA